MASSKINHPFQGSQWLQTEVQTIAGEIAQSPISPKKYQTLTKKLDHALETIQDLEAKNKITNLFIKAQTEYLKETVVHLYRDLEDGFVEREVTQIQQESTLLKKGRITSKAIHQLESHISELEHNHSTSIPHRRIVADAKHVLAEAKAKLEGKPVVSHIDFLAKQKNVRFMETAELMESEIELLPDEVEALFDVAKAVYNRDMRLAKREYTMLPEEHKRRIEGHMQQLLAKPFEDPLETIQALVATANELVGNGESYPSQKEIDQLFLGLSQLDNDADKPVRIYPFKSTL